MKNTLLLFTRFLLILSVSFLMFRCSDDDNEATAYDRVQGSWVINSDNYSPAYDYLGNGQKVTEAFPLYEACEKDNTYILNANYVGELNEGALKCDPADPQSFPISWLLKTNNTVLNISISYQGLSIGQDFDIVQLDAGTMKLKSTFVEQGVTYTQTQTFVRK